jgi:VanZ family protein
MTRLRPRGFGVFWGPVIVYMGLIFFSSSRARPAILSTTPDYLLHGTAYAGLAVLSVRALAKRTFSGLKVSHLLGGIAIAFAYGLSDECHQLQVPGREGSFSDVLADGAGAVVAGAFLLAISAVNGIAGESG